MTSPGHNKNNHNLPKKFNNNFESQLKNPELLAVGTGYYLYQRLIVSILKILNVWIILPVQVFYFGPILHVCMGNASHTNG
jgi:hypothetical protein